MVTEERMQTLFARANPVPDASSVELDPVGAAAYLRILEDRSSEMTQLDTAPQRSEAKKRGTKRGMVAALAGAAAVAVIAAGGVVIALAGGGDVVLTAADFVGVWETPSGVYMQFNDDGTHTAGWTRDELATGTVERGTWSFDGTEFRLTVNDDFPDCAGEVGRYTIEPAGDDGVKWTPIWDPCLDRVADLNSGPMVRVSR